MDKRSIRRSLSANVTNITFNAQQNTSKSKANLVSISQLKKVSNSEHKNIRDGNIESLSDSVIRRFDDRDKLVVKNDKISRTRIIEEIERIKARSRVSEEEKAELIRQAMDINAPKLARRILSERKEQERESSHYGSGAFISSYCENNNDNLNDELKEDEDFCRAIEEVEKLRLRMLTKASVVFTDNHDTIDSKTEEVSDYLDRLLDSDAESNTKNNTHYQVNRSDQLIDVKTELENIRYINTNMIYPQDGGYTPKSMGNYSEYSNYSDYFAERSNPNNSTSPNSFLRSSISEIKNHYNSVSDNSFESKLNTKLNNINQISLESVLHEALCYSKDIKEIQNNNYIDKYHRMKIQKKQTLVDELNILLSSLEVRLEPTISNELKILENNIVQDLKWSKNTNISSVQNHIELKYDLKKSDSSLLAIATAFEAGDVAGKLMADMITSSKK